MKLALQWIMYCTQELFNYKQKNNVAIDYKWENLIKLL